MSVGKIERTQEGSSIRDCLPSITRCYPYKGTEDYIKVLEEEQALFEDDKTRATSQYIVFSNIDEQTYSREIFRSSEKLISKSVDSYSPTEQVLLVKMTTAIHEQAHMGLTNKLITKLAKMDEVNDALHMTSSAQVCTRSRKKRADQEFQPRCLPAGRARKWPTLVIEAGYTESKSKLKSDARWWLDASNGDVRTAVTVSVHQRKREITIEKWGLADRETRSQSDRRAPEIQQRVIMRKDSEEGPTSITNAPFILSFEDLFLRPASDKEGDIVLDVKDLQGWAEKVWELQTF